MADVSPRAIALLVLLFTVGSCSSNDYVDPDEVEPPLRPPEIVLPPSNSSVVVGGQLILYCKATGSPMPEVVFQKGGRPLPYKLPSNLKLTDGDYDSLLVIKPVRSVDAGSYQCQATNNQPPHMVTATAIVQVYGADRVPAGFPEILRQPESRVIEQGASIVLQCTVNGSAAPRVFWLKNNIPLNISEDNRFQTLPGTGTASQTHTLQISGAKGLDDGEYACAAENDKGVVYSTFARVNVRVRRIPPAFTLLSDTVNHVPIGEDVSMTCTAVGSPMPAVRWKKGNSLVSTGKVPIGRNILNLTNVRETANYTCQAISDLGTIEHVFEVHVIAKPVQPTQVAVLAITAESAVVRWEMTPAAMEANQTSRLRYSVEIRPFYPADSQWVSHSVSPSEATVVAAAGPATTVQMQRPVDGLKPYTRYVVRVLVQTPTNVRSYSSESEFATLQGAPSSPPRNVKARVASSTTAIINWDIPEFTNGNVKKYHVYYILASQAALPIEQWVHYPVTPLFAILPDLLRNETYLVSVAASTESGRGPTSEPITVVMVPGLPPAPQNLRVTHATSTTLSLAWNRPQLNDGNIHMVLRSYELYVNASRTRAQMHITASPDHEFYVLDNLAANTAYNIRVTARTELGEGLPSNTVVTSTAENAPSAPPQNVRVEAIKDSLSGDPTSPKKLNVTWDPPPPQLQNGVITSYKVYWSHESDEPDIKPMSHAVNASQKGAYMIGQLQTFTRYRVWVAAATRAGEGPGSEPLLVRTVESVPGMPRSVQVTPINSSAIRVEWRKPAAREQYGTIRGYQIHYSKMPRDGDTSRSDFSRSETIVDEEATEFIAGGLEPSTRYIFEVNAFTQAGDGSRSRTKVVETRGAVPTRPLNFRLELEESSPPQVKATWQAPAQSHGSLDGYMLTFGRKVPVAGVPVKQVPLGKDRLSYTATMLARGAEYEFKVQAKNDVDYGESAVQYVRTPDGVPTGSPRNISAMPKDSTAIVLTWEPPLLDMRHGEIIMYQIYYSKASDALDVLQVNTSETKIQIVGLEPRVDYHFMIKAFTSAGPGPWSEKIVYNSRGRGLLPKPTNVRVLRINSTAMEVSWLAPPAPVAKYRIYYTSEEAVKPPQTPWLVSYEAWDTVVTNGPVNIMTIADLNPAIQYVVRVVALSVTGDQSEASDVTNHVSKSDYQVQNLKAASVQSHSVSLMWDPPSKVTSGTTTYIVAYIGLTTGKRLPIGSAQHRQDVTRTSSLSRPFVIENLQPGVRYRFEVTAVNPSQDPSLRQSAVDMLLETSTIVPEELGYTAQVVSQELGSLPVGIVLQQPTKVDTSGATMPNHVWLVVVPGEYSASEPHQFTNEELLQWSRVPADRQRRQTAADEAVPYIAAAHQSRDLPDRYEDSMGSGAQSGGFVNKPLAADTVYRLFVRTFHDSDGVVVSNSQYSMPFTALGVSDDSVSEATVNQPGQSSMLLPLAGGIGGGVVLIVVIVVVVVVLVRRKSAPKKTSAPDPVKVYESLPSVSSHPNDPVEMRRMNFNTQGMQNHPPIPVTMLATHIERLKATDNAKFSQEYESIEPGQQFTWENSNLDCNKPKNRYANVIAYDHSRVVLQHLEGSSGGPLLGSDYINANYMDGYRKQNAYVSTQGPLPETFGDFWRMVWEQQSATIVMMTKLEERARVKCDQYWPNRGTEMYGPMVVTLIDCMELATYTVRTFHLERVGFDGEKHEVRQFQFTAWPDHGVPDHPTPLLIFMRRVRAATPPDAGPTIVHCSAGVGRTGAFIVIDAMLERIRYERTVDVYGHVTCLRAQRNYMVQTEDQYVFVHDALLEAVESGNTEIPARSLYNHIQKLQQPDSDTSTTTGMETEFKKLTQVKGNPARFVSATLPVNKFKNRLVNIIPYESNRVCLQPIRGVEGSDYINASFVDGYRFRRAYIATQGPLPETTEDFWRMLWEHNSAIVVMLTKCREMGRDKCHQYWPTDRSARYQYFVVDPMAEYSMPQYILREFKVTDARDGQSRTIRQFMFTEWPEQGVPRSGEGFIDFIGQVHKTKEQFGQEGPITVHCSTGVGRTGVFITLSVVLERMKYEGVVDMFLTVKMLRTQRQSMVQSDDQYAFCYQAALEYLASFDHM